MVLVLHKSEQICICRICEREETNSFVVLFYFIFLYFLKLTASNRDFSNLREVLCSYERKRFDKNDFGLQRNFYHVLFPLLSNKVGGDLEHERLYQRKGQLRFGAESKAHSTYIKTLIHFKIPCYLLCKMAPTYEGQIGERQILQ